MTDSHMVSEAILNAVDSIRYSMLFGFNGWLAHVAESVLLRIDDTFGESLTKPNNVFGRRIWACPELE